MIAGLTSAFLLVVLFGVSLCVLYLITPALAAIRMREDSQHRESSCSRRFIILMAAHNEARVIGTTIRQLRALAYPSDLYDICVVADHCSDDTAFLARQAGAKVYARESGRRTGKGAALAWGLEQVKQVHRFDAVVVFDADTLVDKMFLKVMDLRLFGGDKVIQGQHIISNPNDGIYPSFAAASFLVENRLQNLGRSNLGWCVKNMGDSTCFSAEVLEALQWGDGLTEDYELRQRLLLAGYRIVYEPAAKGFGEAPTSFRAAATQRLRWLRGSRQVRRGLARKLLAQGLRKRQLALLDGALQAYVPSFSSLFAATATYVACRVYWVDAQLLGMFDGMTLAWIIVMALLICYPLFGLILERASPRTFASVLVGPVFVLWRSMLAVCTLWNRGRQTWIVTEHGKRVRG